ncbi:MAG: MFS transporter [Candidatus Abyssobacteria bacterium SURF_17]|uniref:MFS transporter n=1 Tax=Candidatus Abyssobacteria bacterium SURF_17 TaxID=2093361 RepID=A0A419EWJ6_9BACT|nr:MAG: MFS transporter [Candidatus Abyssubacteria bacterium SURF_17]
MTNKTTPSENWRYLSQLSINYLGWAACWTVATSYLVPNTLLRMVDDSVKNTRLGLMSGAGNLFLIILIPLVGALSDRMGSQWGRRRPFYLAAAFAMSVLVLLVVRSQFYLMLLALLVLMHGALALWFPNRALVRDIVPLERRGRISGLTTIANTLGIMCAHLVAPRLIEAGKMMFLALLAVAVNVSSNLWVAIRIREESPANAALSKKLSLKEAYFPRLEGGAGLAWLAASNLLTQMGMVAMVCFLLYFIKDQIDPLHFNATFGKLVLIAMATAVPSSLAAGMIADRFGRKRVLLVACLLQVACILNFLISPRVHATLYVSGFLYGLGNGAYLSLYWTILSDLIPEGEASKHIGLMQYTFLIAWTTIPPTLGPIVDRFGASSGMGYNILFITITIFLLAGISLIRKIPETLSKTPPTTNALS